MLDYLEYLNREPKLHNSSFVSSQAYVCGDVNIGADSSVWPMTVIRGDVQSIIIGKRTNIQDGSVLHVTHNGPYSKGNNLQIGNDVTVGHKVVLHGCTIEDESLIGINSVILDGAIVRKHALIAAGSLVPPGKEIIGGFLWIGSPVKKARPITDKEVEYFKYSAAHYVKLKNAHLSKFI